MRGRRPIISRRGVVPHGPPNPTMLRGVLVPLDQQMRQRRVPRLHLHAYRGDAPDGAAVRASHAESQTFIRHQYCGLNSGSGLWTIDH
jgi:hypothetical protein